MKLHSSHGMKMRKGREQSEIIAKWKEKKTNSKLRAWSKEIDSKHLQETGNTA